MVRAKKQKLDKDEVLKAQRAVETAEKRLIQEVTRKEREEKKLWKPIYQEARKVYMARKKRLGLKDLYIAM